MEHEIWNMEFDLNDGYTGVINLPTANITIFLADAAVERKFMHIFLKRCCQCMHYFDCEPFF